MRWMVQVHVDLGQFKIFHVADVPSAAFTLAMLDDAAQDKLKQGIALQPKEWKSGKQMFIMDVLAPYGLGSAAQVIKWIKHSMPHDITSIRTFRPIHGTDRQRIVEHNRIEGARWGTRKLGEV